MEHVWLVILAPLAIVVGLSIVYWLCHPGSICRSMAEMFRSTLRDERGQDLVEYALMAGFVAVVAMAIIPGAIAPFATVMAKIDAILRGVEYYTSTPSPIIVAAKIISAILAVGFLIAIIWRHRQNYDD